MTIKKINYCPNCAHKIDKQSDHLYICQLCSFHFYENPRPTNGLLVENEKGEILLVKRKIAPKKDFWDIPGGFVALDETIEESLIREIREELGANPKDIKYLTSLPDKYLYKGFHFHTLCFVFVGRVNTDELKPHDDISELKFFPKNKIPFRKIAFEGVKKSINIYLSSFDKSKGSP